MGVLTGCKPRAEVLKGDLEDEIFAAHFGDLIAGKAPKVYSDARIFFENTHPAEQLCRVAQAVFGRLGDAKEGGATIRLSTGFGGGKTHTLMALWHLARNIGDLTLGTELLPAAGRPKNVTVVAIDAGNAGVPAFATHGKVETHSLWGEIAYQFGGEKALKATGKTDDAEASPNDRQVEAIFPPGPVLILLDELVIYMAKLSDRGQNNLLGFLHLLASTVGKRRETVLVVTDPGNQAAYATVSEKLKEKLESVAKKLGEIIGRHATDFDPIGKESARVIAKRLFEKIDPAAAQSASATYHALYQRVAQDSPGLIPATALTPEYAKRVVECYPFHPRLLDTAQERLGALQDFQKSRGVLRLFARILRDTWEARDDLELISAGEIDWSSPRIQGDLLQRLGRDNFKAAVQADVERHAGELDGAIKRGIHRRVASALLLESIPAAPNSGLDPAELTLAVLRPDEAGPEPAEALDRLVGVCWHTYPMAGGRGWQFRYEPNIIKQIEERTSDIPIEDAKSRVLSEAQGYFSGPAFKLVSWPSSANQVTESADLQLVLCENERIAKSVCAYADDRDPKALIPRNFQNAIVAVTATDAALRQAVERAQRLLAAEAIERENRTGDAAKIVREQLARVKPELLKQFRLQTCRAFDRVVLAGGNVYPLDEQFQVSEEQMLQRAQGQVSLRRFLEEKDLVYREGAALDTDRFLKNVLPGATPLPNQPDTFTAKAVHERFLAAPGLRLISDAGIVRQTLLKAMSDGKIVIRLADGRAYDANGCVEGPAGRRRRIPSTLTSFALDDSVLVARADSDSARAWVKEDAPGDTPPKDGDGYRPPPPPPGPATATSAEEAIRLAQERPLLELRLIATNPAAAAMMLNLAQPLGAETVTLSVSVGGPLKDGGTMNFAASDVKPSNPLKPLAIAQGIFNSIADAASYEAVLMLRFGTAGRTGMDAALGELTTKAPDGLRVTAVFEKPVGT
jgi:hypothetical protein